jgi:hypothetical protein
MAMFAEEISEAVTEEYSEYRTVQVTSFYRSFCAVLEVEHVDSAPLLDDNHSHMSGLDLVRNGVIGRLHPFDTPYGIRPIVYADWTASGRGHRAVEEYLNLEVLPLYGNTHTVNVN